MNIRIEFERHRNVSMTREQFARLSRDIEGTLRQFPKLKKLTALGAQDYRLDMKTIGSSVARIAHDVSFGARCVADPTKAELSWMPLPDVGNAQMEGLLKLNDEGKSLRLTLSLSVRGELRDVPVPLMYRLVAPAFIQGKFSALVDAFLERVASAPLSRSTQASA
ncbi:MAG: hypothetical protein ACT4PZ_00130 [Panacagrimonas sp.]